MPYGARDGGDDADSSQALLSAEEADDAAADRRMRLAGEPAPEPEHRSTLLTVTPWILGNEFCERLAYYGCATTLHACVLKYPPKPAVSTPPCCAPPELRALLPRYHARAHTHEGPMCIV